MRNLVAATEGSRRTASVPQPPGTGVPIGRTSLIRSPVPCTASITPNHWQQHGSYSATQPGNPRRPTPNRCPQRPRPQTQRTSSPKRAHKTAARRTARVATPTSRPRSAQSHRERRQSRGGNGKKPQGTVVQTDSRSGPLLNPPGKWWRCGDAAPPSERRKPNASSARLRLSKPLCHKADRLRCLFPQCCHRYQLAATAVRAAPMQGAPPLHRHQGRSFLTGEMVEKGPSLSRASQSASHLAGWLAPPPTPKEP
ncbi:hypothetical protein NDU88_007550 [Pleurodeles waltl]|uniref:Uncharacterized protein n=1 Tax=Pleurodeles waltl TaxID=8319 RepID=A0AAV7NBS1_PLEWA|nr:hypothetical protein NDU88_007550 [Pleurodeles waltl]